MHVHACVHAYVHTECADHARLARVRLHRDDVLEDVEGDDSEARLPDFPDPTDLLSTLQRVTDHMGSIGSQMDIRDG